MASDLNGPAECESAGWNNQDVSSAEGRTSQSHTTAGVKFAKPSSKLLHAACVMLNRLWSQRGDWSMSRVLSWEFAARFPISPLPFHKSNIIISSVSFESIYSCKQTIQNDWQQWSPNHLLLYQILNILSVWLCIPTERHARNDEYYSHAQHIYSL